MITCRFPARVAFFNALVPRLLWVVPFFAAELRVLLEAFPARAPATPPTTAPIGPAMLPTVAPATAPAVCFGIGGMSMFSPDSLQKIVGREQIQHRETFRLEADAKKDRSVGQLRSLIICRTIARCSPPIVRG